VKAEILYGFHPVYEALRAGRRTFHEIYISNQAHAKRIKQLTAAVDRKDLPIKEVSAARLQTIAGAVSHQGVAARVSAYPLVEVADLLVTAKSGNRPPFLLLLDHIVDTHNLGAIIRTAVCAGVDAVIIPKDRSAHPSPAVSKVSAGALEYMRVTQVNNIVRVVKTLKDQDLWIVGLDQNAGRSVYAADLAGAIGLVIGGEEKGIRTLVKQNCDFLISIPQTGKVGSLNASVAGAIVMYESYRQRFVRNK
jgi:23S rRNA (guanosine2251-2'-O)-methyltransferase